jgi:hypothetical protein
MNHKTRRTLLSGRPGHLPLLRTMAALLLGGTALAGCVAVPDARHKLHPTTTAEAGLDHADTAPVIVAPEWWHDLHDPQLDRIMADALAGSPTLEDASARLRVVQALIANAKARCCRRFRAMWAAPTNCCRTNISIPRRWADRGAG